jgi:hypothetical protein
MKTDTPMPRFLPRAAAPCGAPRTLPVRRFQRHVHRAGEIAGVDGEAQMRLVGHLVFADEIAPAHLFARQAGGLRRGVHQALHDEVRLGAPRAAIGVGRDRVGEDRLHGEVEVGTW